MPGPKRNRLWVYLNDVVEYTIKGRVRTILGLPLKGVRMRLTLPGGSAIIVPTGRKGAYAFRNLPTGAIYKLRPAKRGWTFKPRVKSILISGADKVQNFKATPR